MTDDVELNEVKCPLLPDASRVHNGDIADIPGVVIKSPKSSEAFTGLTKEELEKFAKDPFWKKLRLISFIVFWLIWLGMLIAAIFIVVLNPRCPLKPKLEFWQKKTGYLVDTMAFADSDNDGVGDFKGLSSKFDYIQKVVGAGYIILDNIFSGQYNNKEKMIGLTNSFRDVDEILGNKESFKTLIKDSRKRGLEVVLTADFNSIHKDSNFFSKNADNFMKWQTGMKNWYSRDGKPSERKFKNNSIYSSSSENSSMFDLDLTNEAVLKEIKESVKMWLDLGVRGFLLTNVAFYVENVNQITESVKKSNESNLYLSNKLLNSQIFCNNTLEFLKEIRKVMNEVAKKTDKSRLLIVEAGNVGFGLTNTSDEMLQYLGGDENVVDMVVSREFLKNRGWNKKKNSKSLVTNYLAMTKYIMQSKVALMSATSTSLRTTELRKIVTPFLLPGNPIIYYGSEIGNECNILNDTYDNGMFYPKEHEFFLEKDNNELPTKCNHMVMPWDNTGKGFSKMNDSYENSFLINVKNTVQSLIAIGRGETILQLHQKLIKVRDEPSLQWGTIKMFFEEKRNGTYEIFIREAKGFPKIIVAIIEDTIFGKVFSFSTICNKIKPLLVYPENPNLPENKEVDASNIYLKNNNMASVHVFKCA